MAKKKTDTPAAAGESKPAAPKKKAAKKAAPASSPAAGFGIDTNLAAQNAVKMLLNRSSAAPSSTGGTVKHLRGSLDKPSSNASIDHLLGNIGNLSGKNSNLPHLRNQQKSHNQAVGHVGNTGVPRRNPG